VGLRHRLISSLLFTSLAACAGASSPTGEPDAPGGFDREVRGGQIHARPIAVDLAGMTGGTASHAALSAILADRDLMRVMPGVTADELAPARAVTTATAGTPLTHLSTRQQVDGIEIRGTYLNLTLRDGRSGPELAASAYHLYAAPRVDTSVGLGEDAAAVAARTALRLPATAVATSASLMIWPLDGGLRLVWVVDLAGADRRALVRANGSRAGEVTVFDDRVFDAAGTVRGQVAVGGAPGGAGVPQLLPLRDLSVSDGAATAITAADGTFALTGTGTTITGSLTGPAATVFDALGANVTGSAPAGPAVALDLGTTAAASVAQVTAFHGVAATRGFLVANGFTAADFGPPLVTNVNLADTCNAYYMPSARTINFFSAGGGCQNSAEASIIAHEYGHFVDDLYGGITEGGLSEGWGDTLACLWRKEPVVGGDLFEGGIIRTCDNGYVYPPGGSDEVHNLGQAWAGFVWHAREQLIAQLGEADGDALIRALALPSLPSNAADIPAAVREVFLRDDDDGDLSNHTPHWDALLAAAQQHGLAFVVDGDLIAPAAVTDLAVASAGISSAVVRWTAPGDDGIEGTATSYDLRRSSAPITADNFATATPIAAPPPVAAGMTQEATVAVAPGTTVYVALRTADEVGNQSAISNVATVTAAPAVTVYSDGAEAGLGSWTATGLWHVTSSRAATGVSSFWYGQEATGNYDTGVANSGILTSPVIDLAGAEQPALVISQYVHVEDLTSYDLLTITVRDVDDPSVSIVVPKETGYTGGVFAPRALDLTTLTGRRIQIDFGFNTVDSLFNATPGWFIDDVTVIAASAGPEPTAGLLINEVLADPAPGYDAGGDGIASTTADEFLELVNPGDAALDLSGYTLADAVATRFTFPAGTTIAAGGVLVVLGGGASTLAAPSIVTSGLYLNNAGDTIRIRTPEGVLAAERSYGTEGGLNTSLVHTADGDAASPVVLHDSISSLLASPGTHTDGSPWGGTPPPPPAISILINEILADPAPGYDPSGDGVASTTADEFLEILNTGTAAADLSGATIADAIGVRVTLPAGTVVPAGGALVVFGGAGVALSLPGVVFVSQGTLALNNGGDTITIAKGADVLATASYGSEGGTDQSLVRAVDGSASAAFVGHTTVSGSAASASPGTRANGSPF
jgi:hypothetical protein